MTSSWIDELRASEPTGPTNTVRHAQRPQQAETTIPTNAVGVVPLDDAGAVALWLARRHVSFKPTDRRSCMAAGCSQRRWEKAVDRLRGVGAMNRRGGWLLHDIGEIRDRLQAWEARRR